MSSPAEFDRLAELDRRNVVDVDLGSDTFKANAHRHMAEWASRPPFYVLGKGPPQVVVGRYADVHRVFSDTETFASEMPTGPGWEQFHKFMDAQFITQMDGSQHARLRRLLMPAFSSRRIDQLKASITTIIEKMLDRIEAKGPDFDGMGDLGSHLVVDALLEAMIQMDPRRKAVFVAFHDVLPATTYTKPGEPFPENCRVAMQHVMDEIKVIIEERRTKPHSDFISDLVNAREAGDKLTDKELFDQIFGLAGGSLSATSRAAGGALLLLYTHDDQRQQLIDNPALIPDALEECLRLGSNGYFTFPRIAVKDTEVGGTRILKGMVVRPSPLSPNYDADVFPDPLRFDIHRKPKRILSFGAGPHHCIGNILGRTAITIAITRLIARFPKAHISEPNFTPVYGGAVGELRLQRLPMRTH
ncbi:cytochrome P450 [Rhodoplanes sp. Z2-YC6860]|uniref:cytochrome P450 n=1 Tax=Rhodoplanes sp. Z2-YC6860 TaxID=674703 RepID=UPI00078E5CEF|nr:cytochrome P450 [Rhodoplanes sp. Z2-YC6860]AMN39589.1 cytochrome P450 [Rhodoplanes sp. Z2-YC6860]